MKPVYLLVGGQGGIGSALAKRLHQSGGTVAIAGREPRAPALLEELGTAFVPLDATSFAGVDNAVAHVVEAYGRLDGAVNLAGSIVLKPAHSTSQEEWERVIQLNLTSAFALVRSAAPAIAKSGGGSIVLMSSAAARIGLAFHDAIAAAKAGVIGLTLSAAATYANRNVRVNGVAPGLVDTPLASRITGNEASLKASISMHPLGKIGEPDQVAAAIAWLLDPGQTWVTGQIIGVDGGLGSLKTR
jgi:NAD(P)-dependent dehydrogenase (short-subunit alcohol dehydrogenase family)